MIKAGRATTTTRRRKEKTKQQNSVVLFFLVSVVLLLLSLRRAVTAAAVIAAIDVEAIEAAEISVTAIAAADPVVGTNRTPTSSTTAVLAPMSDLEWAVDLESHSLVAGSSSSSSSSSFSSAVVEATNNSTCAQYATCSHCTRSSRFCHWCDHDNACHSIGSRYGCTTGVECYSNDRCRRTQPEPIGEDNNDEEDPIPLLGYGVIVGVGGLALLGLSGCRHYYYYYGCCCCTTNSSSIETNTDAGLTDTNATAPVAGAAGAVASERAPVPSCIISNRNRNTTRSRRMPETAAATAASSLHAPLLPPAPPSRRFDRQEQEPQQEGVAVGAQGEKEGESDVITTTASTTTTTNNNNDTSTAEVRSTVVEEEVEVVEQHAVVASSSPLNEPIHTTGGQGEEEQHIQHQQQQQQDPVDGRHRTTDDDTTNSNSFINHYQLRMRRNGPNGNTNTNRQPHQHQHQQQSTLLFHPSFRPTTPSATETGPNDENPEEEATTSNTSSHRTTTTTTTTTHNGTAATAAAAIGTGREEYRDQHHLQQQQREGDPPTNHHPSARTTWGAGVYSGAQLGVLLLMLGAVVYYPHLPTYSICNDEVAWTQIMKHLLTLQWQASFEVLASVKNPNALPLPLVVDPQAVAGTLTYQDQQFGTFAIPGPIRIQPRTITDVMILIQLEFTNHQQVFDLVHAYYHQALLVTVQLEATLRFPTLWNYTHTIATPSPQGLQVDVSAFSDRRLCHCPTWTNATTMTPMTTTQLSTHFDDLLDEVWSFSSSSSSSSSSTSSFLQLMED